MRAQIPRAPQGHGEHRAAGREDSGARPSRSQRQHRSRGVGNLLRSRGCVAAAGGTPALRKKSSRRATGPRSQRQHRSRGAKNFWRCRRCGAATQGARRRLRGIPPSLAGEFGAEEWETDELGTGRAWQEKSLRHAKILQGCSTARRDRSPRSAAGPQPTERGCVRRGPAAAAPKRRGRTLNSDASHAANRLRLVLRAHSRAPGEIFGGWRKCAREITDRHQSSVADGSLVATGFGRRPGRPMPRQTEGAAGLGTWDHDAHETAGHAPCPTHAAPPGSESLPVGRAGGKDSRRRTDSGDGSWRADWLMK